MFRKYEKTYRILVPQIDVKGKRFLNDRQVKTLLGGTVSVTEKLDGANVGIIRHKDEFRLQKRGSLVDTSEHFQFNFFKAWSQANYNKLMQIPKGITLYGELMICRHHIFYDELPDYFVAFAMCDSKKGTYLHRDDMVSMCDSLEISYAPEITRGYFRKNELFDLIPEKSAFSSTEEPEGIVVWNHKHNLRGKVVRESFVKDLNDTVHWQRKVITKNLVKK